MILHTIVDPQIIWGTGQFELNNDIQEISYKGVQLIARKIKENTYMVDRILSTDLKHFLDPDLQPGRIIEYTLQS